ncbi:hypothetical protein MHY1_00717 [Methylovirgula sp. HY1]|nr:hypothetical protein MHY1_00717 [Methylovirgula sp. HY1]
MRRIAPLNGSYKRHSAAAEVIEARGIGAASAPAALARRRAAIRAGTRTFNTISMAGQGGMERCR